ncbi:MAG: NAD-dependent epimerase/dehydratase family protein, partial [Verrucomicrobiota bacterium]
MTGCLITGGGGNLAGQLTWELAPRFGRIVLLDVAPGPVGGVSPRAVYERGDLLDAERLDAVLRRHRPAVVIHLASLLSGSCEEDRPRAWQVNMDGSFALFEAALRHGSPAVLFASTIAAFGGPPPAVLADDTPQWPEGLYGVTKMAVERLGVYYHRRHGLDFRCLRIPITLSRQAPAGAASALASRAFVEVARGQPFTFRARPDTRLALVHVRDVLRGLDGLLGAPEARLSRRVYNIGAMTVTPAGIVDAIRRRRPDADLRFEPDPA